MLGLGAAALLAVGHLTGMLLLGLVLLAGLAIAVRNPYGMLAVLVTAATVAAVCLYASAVVQAGFGYAMTWFLLFGSVRPVMELQHQRRRGRARRSDADQLARLTPDAGRGLGRDLRRRVRRGARHQRPLARPLTWPAPGHDRPPASGLRHPASGIRRLASGIRHPASGI